MLKFHGNVIDFSVLTDHGDSYMHLAAEKGDPAVIQMLLRTKAADMLDLFDRYGRTPFLGTESQQVRKLLAPDAALFDNKIRSPESYKRTQDYLFDTHQKA